MSLRGNLNSVDLANIFQMLSINQKEGTLNIFDGDSKKSIYFSREGVSMLSRGKLKKDTLGRILLRYDRLTEAQLSRALEKQQNSGRLLGSILEESKMVPREIIEDALRIQIEEEIYNLFIWKDASFEFIEGSPPKEFDEVDGAITQLTFNVNSLIMEAARRIDEWEQIQVAVPSTNEVYQYTGRNMELSDDIFREPWCEKVLASINGRNSAEEIIEKSFVNKFEVCKILSLLLEQEAVEPIGPADLTSAAHAALEKGAVPEAVKFLERVVELGADDGETHLALGQAYEKLQEICRAAVHYRKFAEDRLASGRPQEAFDVYRRIAELLPTDLAATERMIEIFVTNQEGLNGHGKFVVEKAKMLATIFLEIGKNNRAVQSLHRVIGLDPEDFSLRNLLVNIYLANNMSSEAIAEYESMAEWYGRRRDWEQVIRILRKILVIDRNRDDVSHRLQQLLTRKEKKKRNLRRLALTLVIVTGLSVLLYGYLNYELDASRRAAEAETAAQEMLANLNTQVQPLRVELDELAKRLEKGDTDLDRLVEVYRRAETLKAQYEDRIREAIAKLEEVATNYKFARAKKEALERQDELNELKAGFEVSVAAAKKEIQSQALRLADEADREVRKGHGTAALAAYKKAWEIAIDRDPLTLKDVDRKIADLEVYVESLNRTQESIRKLTEKGDYETARQQAERLLARYFTSELLETVPLYVRFESDPPGARILANGEDSGVRTPGWVPWFTGFETTFTIDLEGFAPAEEHLAAAKPENPDRDLPRVLETKEIRRDLRKEVRWSTNLEGAVQGHPAVDGESIYVATRGSKVFRVDLAEDRKTLLLDAKGSVSGFRADPVLDGNALYLATLEGKLRRVSRTTGETVWEQDVGGMVYAPLSLANGILLAADVGGKLLAYDVADGHLRWQKELEGEIRCRPVVDGGRVLTVTTSGHLYVHLLDDGRLEWDTAVGDGSTAFFGAPLVAGGVVYLGSTDRRLYAIDVDPGERRELWSVETGAELQTSPVMLGGTLFAATVEGTVVAIRDGQILDTMEVGGTMRNSPALDGDRILLVNDTGRLVSVSFVDGRFRTNWQFEIHDGEGRMPHVQVPPVVVGDHIVVLSESGDLFVLSE